MTDKQKAVMQQALDALVHIWNTTPDDDVVVDTAITTPREALAAANSVESEGIKTEEQPPFGSKRKAAMAVYVPPFRFGHGYIYDSQNKMAADDAQVEGAVASRVRGWGRLGYMPNGAELQDEIGQMIADALNAYYAAPIEPVAHATVRTLQPNECERKVIIKWVNQPVAGPLFASPPPPPLVPLLTDEHIANLLQPYGSHSVQGFDHVIAFARTIEQSVRQKVGIK